MLFKHKLCSCRRGGTAPALEQFWWECNQHSYKPRSDPRAVNSMSQPSPGDRKAVQNDTSVTSLSYWSFPSLLQLCWAAVTQVRCKHPGYLHWYLEPVCGFLHIYAGTVAISQIQRWPPDAIVQNSVQIPCVIRLFFFSLFLFLLFLLLLGFWSCPACCCCPAHDSFTWAIKRA